MQFPIFEFLCRRSVRLSRLVIFIVVIQAICGVWIVYRLKRPHKLVRSLIKHPYHLFNKAQFKQEASELSCSPDSQEAEASVFREVTAESVKVSRQHWCTYCHDRRVNSNTSLPSENITHWQRRLREHGSLQQSSCEEEVTDAKVVLLDASSDTALGSIRISLVVYIASVLTRTPFIISAPASLTHEVDISVRHLDWRPFTSHCGHEGTGSSQLKPLSCNDVLSALGLSKSNRSESSVAEDSSHLRMECVKTLLSRAGKVEALSTAQAHAIASASFRYAFGFPMAILVAIKKFMSTLNSRVQPVTGPRDPESRGTICIDTTSGLSSSNPYIWRCAHFLERIAGADGNITWVLLGRNVTQVNEYASAASHYLLCSGMGMNRTHTIATWTSPFSGRTSSIDMSSIYLLSQCTAHVGASDSDGAQFASLMSGRKYMYLKSKAKGWANFNRAQLQDVCKLKYGW